MANEVFMDTSGFYALLVKADDAHERAVRFMEDSARDKRHFVTTDYVLDETVTLLTARGQAHLRADFFESVMTSRSCRIVWMDAELFDKAKRLCLARTEHNWSFTDCVSFVVMRDLRLRQALTKDSHFRAAGFEPLLV